jgi:pyruvate ferredoxin oxidoreductase gamma subunit
MFEVRIHGRGGQGVVTAAELLSVAAFDGGRHAQAFPTFGSERTGAPVVSFVRVSETPIRSREPVAEPDAVIVQDATLLNQVDVLDGIRPDGYLLLNSPRSFDELGLGALRERLDPSHMATVPATELALEHVGRPVPNVPLLGAFVAMTGLVELDAVVAALHERFPTAVAERNAAAARAAYDALRATASAAVTSTGGA